MCIRDRDKDWVPSAPDTSLYLRPFTIATEAHLGVKPSNTYQFIIIASPSVSYTHLDVYKRQMQGTYTPAGSLVGPGITDADGSTPFEDVANGCLLYTSRCV